jgi:hypothetical protein
MTLLAIAVLVPAVGVGRLGRRPVVPHERLVLRRVLLGMPFLVHCQRHAVRAMTLGHATHFPKRILDPLAQAGEALREAQRRVLPVRVGQHEVVQQVRKRLPLNGHPQALHVREVRGGQPARLMYLAEEQLLGRTVLGLPLVHPPLQCPPHGLPAPLGIFPLQPFPERLGLQARLPLQKLLHARPHGRQRIRPGPPAVRLPRLVGKLPQVPILPGRLAIHTALHRSALERRSLVQPLPQLLDLRVGDASAGSHRQLLSPGVADVLGNAAATCSHIQWGKIIVAGGER